MRVVRGIHGNHRKMAQVVLKLMEAAVHAETICVGEQS